MPEYAQMAAILRFPTTDRKAQLEVLEQELKRFDFNGEQAVDDKGAIIAVKGHAHTGLAARLLDIWPSGAAVLEWARDDDPLLLLVGVRDNRRVSLEIMDLNDALFGLVRSDALAAVREAVARWRDDG